MLNLTMVGQNYTSAPEGTSVENYRTTETQDTSIFSGENTTEETGVTNDEKEDSKVSFLDGAKAFFSGVKDKVVDGVKNFVELAKNDPLQAAAVGIAGVGAGALATCAIAAGGIPAIVAGGIMAGAGGYFAYKDAGEFSEACQDLKNANGDEEAILEALHDMGGETFDLLGDGLMVASGTSAIVAGSKGIQAGKLASETYATVENMYNTGCAEAEINQAFQMNSGAALMTQAEANQLTTASAIGGTTGIVMEEISQLS